MIYKKVVSKILSAEKAAILERRGNGQAGLIQGTKVAGKLYKMAAGYAKLHKEGN